ncbi:MAG: ATP-binding protein [Bacteroidales bacterium]|nr:ATP-binding protein [Bacteroidales bacterium]
MLIVRFTNPTPFSRSERHLVLQNDISQIPKLASFIEDIAKEAKMDPARAMSLNLAMEEAVSNIILYAYPQGAEGQVEVKAVIKEDRLDFTLTDSGVPFDPTLAHMPDLTLDAAERPIGGLGIYLVRSIMDSVAYERLDGKNVLSMTKKL